jgi:hypothetical protein
MAVLLGSETQEQDISNLAKFLQAKIMPREKFANTVSFNAQTKILHLNQKTTAHFKYSLNHKKYLITNKSIFCLLQVRNYASLCGRFENEEIKKMRHQDGFP